MIRAGVEEVHETSTAVELSEEDGGVGLRFGGFDPLKTRSYATVFTAAFSKNSTSVAAHTHFLEGKTSIGFVFEFEESTQYDPDFRKEDMYITERGRRDMRYITKYRLYFCLICDVSK